MLSRRFYSTPRCSSRISRAESRTGSPFIGRRDVAVTWTAASVADQPERRRSRSPRSTSRTRASLTASCGPSTKSAWKVAFFCDVAVPGPERKLTKQSPPNIATFFRKFASCPCSSGPRYAQKPCAARVAGMRKSARNRAASRSCHPMTSAMPATSCSARPAMMSVGTRAAAAPCAASSLAARVWSRTPTALQRKMRARVTRPIHSPYRISRSPQFGGDQVRHDGWRPGDVEASNALLDGPITNGDALMLAQVLEPGLDDERFDITPLLCWVLVDSPADGAIPVANLLQVPDGLHKGTRVGRVDSVFNLDADRSFVRGRDDVEVRLGPVRRRREIERGDRA